MTNGRRLLVLTLGSALAAGLSALPVLAGGSGCTKTAADCSKMIADGFHQHGWIGLEMDKDESGALVVTKVLQPSPAARAGFRTGDVLVALNGVALDDHDKVRALKAGITPGTVVKYTVKRNGSDKDLMVKFEAAPESVVQTAVNAHLAEHDAAHATTR